MTEIIKNKINSYNSQIDQIHAEYALNKESLIELFSKRKDFVASKVFKFNRIKKELLLEIDFLKNKFTKLEKFRSYYNVNEHLGSYLDNVKSTMVENLKHSIETLNNLQQSDIITLRSFEQPPRLVSTIFDIIMILRDDKPTWSEEKLLLSDTYFFPFFIPNSIKYAKQMITSQTPLEYYKIVKIQEFAYMIESDLSHIKNVNVVCAALAEWFLALYEFSIFINITNDKNTSLNVDPLLINKHLEEVLSFEQEHTLEEYPNPIYSELLLTQQISKSSLSIQKQVDLDLTNMSNRISLLEQILSIKAQKVECFNKDLIEMEEEHKDKMKELEAKYDETIIPIQQEIVSETANYQYEYSKM